MKLNLSLFGLGMFLTFGSVSCAPDNQKQESTRLATPVLVSSDRKVSLKEVSENNTNSWSLSDEIHFPESGDFNRIQTEARCILNEKEWAADFSLPLQSMALHQILPNELLFSLDEKNPAEPALCSVEFKASTPQGNVHHFAISHLKVSAPQNISISVSADLKFYSNGNYDYKMECRELEFDLPENSQMTLSASEIQSFTLKFKVESPSAQQNCRIVGKEQNSIKEISQLITLDFSQGAIESQWKIENQLSLPRQQLNRDEHWGFLNSEIGALIGHLELKNNSKFVQKVKPPASIPFLMTGYEVGMDGKFYCKKNTSAALILNHDEAMPEIEISPGQVVQVEYRVMNTSGRTVFPPFAFGFPQNSLDGLAILPPQIIWSLKGVDPSYLRSCGVAL